MDFEVVPHPPKKITADPMSPMAPRQRGTLQIESDRLSWWLLQNADNPNVSFSDGFELYGIYGTQWKSTIIWYTIIIWYNYVQFIGTSMKP